MNFVVLTAGVIMLKFRPLRDIKNVFSLAEKGRGPKSLLKLNKKGAPVNAILAADFFSPILLVIMNYVSPDKVFMFFT
ncbi:hypothetical protein [Lysinibacillus pakistanensis]|uniref:hypothetical protein n=1 Tax=Lysinibacillus pakistanensis TaxID=759811 RepID=UPI003D2DAAA3